MQRWAGTPMADGGVESCLFWNLYVLLYIRSTYVTGCCFDVVKGWIPPSLFSCCQKSNIQSLHANMDATNIWNWETTWFGFVRSAWMNPMLTSCHGIASCLGFGTVGFIFKKMLLLGL